VRCERPKKKRRPCAPTSQTCTPPTSQACAPYARRRARPRRRSHPPHMDARPLLASVRAPLDVRAPTWQACAPYALRRACPPQVCVPPSSQPCVPCTHGYVPPLDVCAPHLSSVRALPPHTCAPPPHRRRARPTPQKCSPYPAGVCASQQPCAPPSSQACTP
jgi:hypothetical protein